MVIAAFLRILCHFVILALTCCSVAELPLVLLSTAMPRPPHYPGIANNCHQQLARRVHRPSLAMICYCTAAVAIILHVLPGREPTCL